MGQSENAMALPHIAFIGQCLYCIVICVVTLGVY